jgi:hypothetical protein
MISRLPSQLDYELRRAGVSGISPALTPERAIASHATMRWATVIGSSRTCDITDVNTTRRLTLTSGTSKRGASRVTWWCGRRATANLRPFVAYSPERQVQFFDRMLAGIEKLPGLRYAAVMSSPPMAPFSELDCGMRADNGPRIDDAVSITSVSTQCVQALGIRLVAGMFFDARDRRGGPQVNSVNQTLAHLTFRGSNPLGHRIKIGCDAIDQTEILC